MHHVSALDVLEITPWICLDYTHGSSPFDGCRFAGAASVRNMNPCIRKALSEYPSQSQSLPPFYITKNHPTSNEHHLPRPCSLYTTQTTPHIPRRLRRARRPEQELSHDCMRGNIVHYRSQPGSPMQLSLIKKTPGQASVGNVKMQREIPCQPSSPLLASDPESNTMGIFTGFSSNSEAVGSPEIGARFDIRQQCPSHSCERSVHSELLLGPNAVGASCTDLLGIVFRVWWEALSVKGFLDRCAT